MTSDGMLPSPSIEATEVPGLPDSITETAIVIGQIVQDPEACPDNVARALYRRIGHSLAAESAAERRHRRLGLLIELVSKAGEFISVERYEEVRKARAAQGADWPSASNLSRSYGNWLIAVKAACRFWFDGGSQRVSDNHGHARGTQPGYKPIEITSALRECKIELHLSGADWPTQWEYEEWAQIKRRFARKAGTDGSSSAGGDGAAARGPTGRRFPGLKQIRTAFSTYDEAVRAAHRTGGR